MPFEKGQKKTGGRQMGVKNKTTTILHEICELEGIDPFHALIKIANDPKTKTGTKVSVLKNLCEYLYPKRQRVEIDHQVYAHVVKEIEELSQLSTDDLKDLIRKEIDKLEGKGTEEE